MAYIALGEGKPINCLMSALSIKAKSMVPDILEVDKMRTLGNLEEMVRRQNYTIKVL